MMQDEPANTPDGIRAALRELGIDETRLLEIRHPEIRRFAMYQFNETIAFFDSRFFQLLLLIYVPVNLLLLWMIGSVSYIYADPLAIIAGIVAFLLVNLYIVRNVAKLPPMLAVETARQNMEILARRLPGRVFLACYAGEELPDNRALLKLQPKPRQGMEFTSALQDFITACELDRLRMIQPQSFEASCLPVIRNRPNIVARLVVLELLSGLCTEDEINAGARRPQDAG